MASIVFKKSSGVIIQNSKHSNFVYGCKLIQFIRQRSYSNIAADARFYTKKHEWVVLNENVGTVGISQYAQESLGDIVFVQLPEVGSDVNPQDECGALESVKAASELYAPVSGTVIEINTSLEEKPELVNKNCYNEGWLFKLKLNDIKEVESLMNEDQYQLFLKSDH